MPPMRRHLGWLVILLLAFPVVSRAQDVKGDLLQKKIKDLEAELSDQEDTLRVERGKTNAMSAKALALEHQLEEALGRIKVLEARVAELDKQLADALAALKAANDRIAQLEKELAEAKARIAQLEKELAEERAKNKVATDRIVELERLLAAEREKNAALEKRVADLTRENGGLEATVASTRDALKELEKRKAEADARVAEFRALIARFKALIDAGKLRVKIVDGRMVVELATDVLFSSGSAQLSNEGKKAIFEVAKVLASIPDRKFQVEGHTDNVPISTEQFPSNWELAAARSITVVKTMLVAGMPPPRIAAASFADVRPAVPNDTKEGKKANRRIEITLVPDLSSLPGFDELNKVSSGN